MACVAMYVHVHVYMYMYMYMGMDMYMYVLCAYMSIYMCMRTCCVCDTRLWLGMACRRRRVRVVRWRGSATAQSGPELSAGRKVDIAGQTP